MDDIEDWDAELAAGRTLFRLLCPTCGRVIPLPTGIDELQVQCPNGHAFGVKVHTH